ncbi:GNAT family N-acetyltransferase [Betaproteobacteria bacterium GR16-43]|nr:GNAT family N-acetyltransferase [Betaproteobacteria bacterium GR16-43]
MTQLRLLASLDAIPAPQWNALAGDNPTLAHAFLDALHVTGCASAESGWAPQYLTLWDGERLAGGVPLYVKGHSYGEYVFDWAWAEAHEKHGLAYYPKLLAAVPFTPATGFRLLAESRDARVALAAGMLKLAKDSELSSAHVLFPDDRDAEVLRAGGWLERTGVQFHWRNPGYANFEEFLGALSHDKRKKIRQERRKVFEAGVTFRRVTGHEATGADWDFFTACYRRTYRAHRSTPYLNRAFFGLLGERMPGNVLLVIAERDGFPIAAALDLFSASAFYGRYWGAMDYVPGLHFEACYYQAMEFCIERRIPLFEGGAQGEHKHARGFLPSVTRSFHWLAHPAFERAVDDYLAREGSHIAEYVDELNDHSPFKK